MYVFPSFFRPNTIYSIVCAALFIQSLVDGHLGSFSLLAVVSPAAMNVDRHLDTLNQDVLWPHST